MTKTIKVERQRPIPGIRRDRAYVALHPAVKSDLMNLARQERKSASFMVATLIMDYWQIPEPEPKRKGGKRAQKA